MEKCFKNVLICARKILQTFLSLPMKRFANISRCHGSIAGIRSFSNVTLLVKCAGACSHSSSSVYVRYTIAEDNHKKTSIFVYKIVIKAIFKLVEHQTCPTCCCQFLDFTYKKIQQIFVCNNV